MDQTWDVRAKGPPPPPPPPSKQQQGRNQLIELLSDLGTTRLEDQRSPTPGASRTPSSASFEAMRFLLPDDPCVAGAATEGGAGANGHGRERGGVIVVASAVTEPSDAETTAAFSEAGASGALTAHEPSTPAGTEAHPPATASGGLPAQPAEKGSPRPSASTFPAQGDAPNGNAAATATATEPAVQDNVHEEAMFPVSFTQLALRTGTSGAHEFAYSVEWSDGHSTAMQHSYESLFQFHCPLLDAFPIEAGQTDAPRTIPPLPGKKLLGSIRIRNPRRVSLDRAEKRQPQITAYLEGLLLLPNIQRCRMLRDFVNAGANDSSSAPEPGPADVAATHTGAFLMLFVPAKKGWRQRYCRISPTGHLQCYRKVPSSRKASADLEVVMASALDVSSGFAAAAPEDVSSDCGIQIQLTGSTINLFAQTPHDAQRWLNKLKVANRTASALDHQLRLPAEAEVELRRGGSAGSSRGSRKTSPNNSRRGSDASNGPPSPRFIPTSPLRKEDSVSMASRQNSEEWERSDAFVEETLDGRAEADPYEVSWGRRRSSLIQLGEDV